MVPGILQVVEWLENKGIRKCIASNAMLEHISSALFLTGMSDFFNRNKIFDVSMVKEGKPKPDIFLCAADRLQVDPVNCLVIEDSIVGIQAAKEANMPVVGFLGATHAKNISYQKGVVSAKPDMMVDNSNELLQLLKKRL